MNNIKRSAKRIWIGDILKSTIIKNNGIDQNQILTIYGEIYKVLIMGLIVSLEDNAFLIDDGTGIIRAVYFDKKIFDFSLGDFVLVIGKVREYNNNKYIPIDIIRKVDKKWFDIHKLELNHIKKIDLPIQEEDQNIGPYQKVINLIAVMDKGEGVDISKIIASLNIENCELIINNLIEEGEIFEISPGKVKLLL